MPATTVLNVKPIQHPSLMHWLAGLLALACGVVGFSIGLHYPVDPPLMAGLLVIFITLFYIWSSSWLVVVPAMMPVIGFAPWTGWLTFEELDLLVLAVAAAGYTRLAFRKTPPHRSGLPVSALILMTLFLGSVLVAMFRGFADAGGFSFGWFQGYHEPMNSVRLGKSFFLAMLLVPLWQVACRQNPERAQSLLSLGLMLGLAAAALTTVWERAAFTDLLNFSADYRTTGMFWEMHVGGAALDGFLVLTVPFAVRKLMVARTTARWGMAATVLALAAYACLTTFSRGVYLAMPVGAIVFLSLHTWQQEQLTLSASESAQVGEAGTSIHLGAALLLTVGFGMGASWMFQSSGYRGMAALLGTVALMLPLVQLLRGFKASHWLVGVVIGMLLILLTGAIAWLLPKGAYVAWGLAAALTGVMLELSRRATQANSFAGPMAFGGFLATVTGTALVADHWGEAAGFRHATPALLAVLGICAAAGMWRKPLWPEALRWQATTAGAMGLVAAVVGVMGGGAYMSDRFSTGGQDLGGRLAHWQLGRNMLSTPADWWLGKGLGRFPANYFLNGNPQQRPGDYRLNREGNSSFLTLTGGLHVNGDGELFRVTQRVGVPGKQAVVTAQVRAENNVMLHFEVCEKHLLYSQGCVSKLVSIKGAPGVWQDLRVALQGNGATRGAWYAPHLLAFSVAMGTRGGKVSLDNLALSSADGRQLVANGDFSAGMAHWFYSSDRNHLPWHIKSLLMNELFDQGIVGLTLLLLLYLGAMWRLSIGQARTHPLAPALAAALIGFAVVGLFDSLLDVPRLAWLYYTLTLIGLTLPARRLSP